MSDFQVDTRELSKALRQYEAATKKEIPEILNRAARNIAYRAASYTPVAKPSRIRRDLERDPHLAFALTSIQLKKRGIGILEKPDFALAVKRFISHREAGSGFIRSGWAESIIALGGSFRGKRIGRGHGWAKKANLMRYIAEIANTVPGVDKIGKKALQEAVDFVSADMINYAQKKLQKAANKHSAK